MIRALNRDSLYNCEWEGERRSTLVQAGPARSCGCASGPQCCRSASSGSRRPRARAGSGSPGSPPRGRVRHSVIISIRACYTTAVVVCVFGRAQRRFVRNDRPALGYLDRDQRPLPGAGPGARRPRAVPLVRVGERENVLHEMPAGHRQRLHVVALLDVDRGRGPAVRARVSTCRGAWARVTSGQLGNPALQTSGAWGVRESDRRTPAAAAPSA
jgi:hypothetical protein